MSEKSIQQEIFKAIGSRQDVRLFRNPVGFGYVGSNPIVNTATGSVTLHNWRKTHFGLHVGSGDLIGWQSVTVTPEMAGLMEMPSDGGWPVYGYPNPLNRQPQTLAVFLSLEVKTENGRAKPDQHVWLENVLAHGGRAGIVRSAEEAGKILI